MTDWVRLWHDMPTDPKWRVIARKSETTIPEVISVFVFLMTDGSANATERGRTHANADLFAEDLSAALGVDESRIEAILSAMRGKVLDKDGWLLGWQKRQPKREDNSAERAKAWRDERNRTQPNATERPETETDKVVPLGKPNGAEPDQVFWANAKAFVAPETKGDPGKLVGAWCRDYGKAETAQAITKAQLERPAQRIPFIIGCLKKVHAEPRIGALG